MAAGVYACVLLWYFSFHWNYSNSTSSIKTVRNMAHACNRYPWEEQLANQTLNFENNAGFFHCKIRRRYFSANEEIGLVELPFLPKA